MEGESEDDYILKVNERKRGKVLQNPLTSFLSKHSCDKKSTALIKIKDYGCIDGQERLNKVSLSERILEEPKQQVIKKDIFHSSMDFLTSRLWIMGGRPTSSATTRGTR